MNQNTISKSIFLFFCDRIEIQALSVANDDAVGGIQRQETFCFITVLTVSERVKAIHSFMEFHQAKPLINSTWESFFLLHCSSFRRSRGSYAMKSSCGTDDFMIFYGRL